MVSDRPNRRSLRRRAIGVALFALLPGLTFAADLLAVYRLARDGDPTFATARASLEAIEQKVPQARAGLLPTVGLSGNDNSTRAYTRFSDAPVVDRQVRSWTWAVQLTQPVLRLANVFAYRTSLAEAEAAEAQFAQAEQELILRVAQTYFDVLVAEEGVTVGEAQERALQAQWVQAKRGYEAGLRAITDMHEAKSKVDQARADRVAAENARETKRSELEKLIGSVPAHLARLGATIVLPLPEPADPRAWAQQAREQFPGVRAQTNALAAAESQVSRSRAEHLPTLDLTASKGSNYASGSLTTPVDYTTNAHSAQVGLQLNVPLFAGGATQAKVGETIANRAKAEAQLEEVRRQAAAQAKEAYAAIVNGQAQIEALESAVVSGEYAVKGNQVGYRIGVRINSDVLTAEQQLYASRRDLVRVRYEVLLQGLKLKAAAGVLGEGDLETINRQLVER